MAINKYPYTNFNEYNLDWVILKIKEFETELTDYEALHSITFGGDWDISKSYTQWTIVSDPISHNGYLSLQPVPYNVPITNTAYWLKIADYTTGLAAVNTRVDNVEDYITNTIDPAITAISDDITNNIKPDIDAIEADITDNIKPDIDAIEADITDNIKPDILAAQADASLSKNRKILIFGDSYFEDLPPSGDTNFRSYLEALLENIPNIEFDLKSDGGEGFGQPGSYSFLYDVTNYTSVFNPDEVTDVFFVGGYNDRNNATADIQQGMINCFSLVKTKYPNAKISVGHFGWSATLSSTDRTAIVTKSILNYRRCMQYGAAYMINSEYTLHNYDLIWINDLFHPNGDGHRELAKQIVQYILTGSCDVHYGFKRVQFNQGDVVATNVATAYDVGYKLDNDMVTIYLPNKELSFTTTFDLPVTTFTQVLQLTTNIQGFRGYAIGMYDDAVQYKEKIPVSGYLQVTSGGLASFRDLADCLCVLQGGFLHIRPYGINADVQ